jgi:hypothetical protein
MMGGPVVDPHECGSWEVEMGADGVPSLDRLPAEMLVAAARDSENAISVKEEADGGYVIRTQAEEWRSGGDPDTRAQMEAGVMELVSRRYIEEAGIKPDLFKVTQLGEQMAKVLSKSGSQASGSHPPA